MPSVVINEPNNGTTYFSLYKTWTNTPQFRKLIAEGKLLPENVYSFESHHVRATDKWTRWGDHAVFSALTFYSQAWYDTKFRLDNYDGYCRTPTAPGPGDKFEGTLTGSNKMKILAGNKLSKKLNSRDIDLGVALGEARETAHFIQGAMLGVYVAAKRARKGDLSGVLQALGLSGNSNPKLQRFRDVPDKVAGAWLGFSYGVRPLMADVLGACKALEKRHEQPLLITHRSSVREEINLTLSTTACRQGGWGDTGPDVMYERVGWHKASDKITFEVDNPVLYKLSELGLTNPLSVAWELVTLSFVVDWFLPIGSWINGLVPPQGVTNVRRCQTYTGYVEVLAEHTACNSYGGSDFADFLIARTLPPQVAKGRSVQKWKERRPMAEFPRFHLVGAEFDLSKQQVMSGLSLLWTLGAGEKSQAKAYKDAIDLNSRKYSSTAGNLSREATGAGNKKKLQVPKYLFPSSYAGV